MSENVPEVGDGEVLARFILFSKWVRNDQTVRADAFIPYPYPNLSVTRHLGLDEAEVWNIGEEIAKVRSATLYGQANIVAKQVTNKSLSIIPTKMPRNHANITGWPVEKPAQKMIAMEIAAMAKYVAKPI